MTRTPLALAALASAAVPGLDPAFVEGVISLPGHQFDVAFINDTQHRRWVLRAPMSAAAGAQMDVSVSLLGLLARRLPFSVPTPKGFVSLREGGRAVVYPYITGRPLNFAQLPSGPGIAAELGRALAALHNVDLVLCDEAGLTSYDPDTYRTRRLADLDRAAATGHVPTGLLSRWERSLEEVSLWRFAPTPTHGDLTGDEVLAVFDDDTDATTGHVCGLTSWENAKVADPADDFATLVTQASPSAFDSVLEAYAGARTDQPDKNLERRARLAGELKLVAEPLTAVGSGDQGCVQACAEKLRQLAADTVDERGTNTGSEPLASTSLSGRTASRDPRLTEAPGIRDVDVTETMNVSKKAEVTETIEVLPESEITEPIEVLREPEITETIEVLRDAVVTGGDEDTAADRHFESTANERAVR
ncbi:MAG: phosphotransferase [Dermatophilaceae bacterium]|nr:phosphotransferase [Dermatophilaceae bacterium]